MWRASGKVLTLAFQNCVRTRRKSRKILDFALSTSFGMCKRLSMVFSKLFDSRQKKVAEETFDAQKTSGSWKNSIILFSGKFSRSETKKFKGTLRNVIKCTEICLKNGVLKKTLGGGITRN